MEVLEAVNLREELRGNPAIYLWFAEKAHGDGEWQHQLQALH